MTQESRQSLHLQRKLPFLLNLFKSLLWNYEIYRPFQYICFLFSNLQCIAILLQTQFNCIATNDHDSFSNAINQVSKTFSFKGLTNSSSETPTEPAIVSSVIFCYFIGLIMTSIITARGRHKKPSQKTESILVYYAQFHLSIGFWLVCMTLLDYLAFTIPNIFNSETTAFQIFITIFSLIFLVLNYLFGFVFAFFSYDPYISSSVLSSHSPSFQAFTWVFKALAALLMATTSYSTPQIWANAVISVIILGIRHWYLAYSFPYYNYWTMKTSLRLSILAFAISVINVIALIVKIFNTISPIVLPYIMLPCIFLLVTASQTVLDAKVRKYYALPNEKIKTKQDVFKKLFSVRVILSKAVVTVSDKNDRSNHYEVKYIGVISQFYQNKVLQSGHTNKSDLTVNEICTQSSIYGEQTIKELLQEAITRIKDNSQFKIILGHFALSNNLPFLATSLLMANPDSFRGRLKIEVAQLREVQQNRINKFFEDNRGQILNLKVFLESEAVSAGLIKILKSTTEKYVHFWSHYLKPQLSMRELYKTSLEIELGAVKAEKIWNDYAPTHRVFAHTFCNLYSTYLSLIRGSPNEAHKVYRKYFLHNLDQVLRTSRDHALSDDTLMRPNVLAFYASMSKEYPGKVLYCSSNLTSLLGWTQVDLIDKNIERIMPQFMQQPHQRILATHISDSMKGEKELRLYKTIDGFVQHKLGYVVSCETYLSIHPYVQDTPMYLVLLRKRETQGNCLLVSQSGSIEGFSREIGRVLGLNLKRKVLLGNLCKDFSELQGALNDLNANAYSKNKNEEITPIHNKRKGELLRQSFRLQTNLVMVTQKKFLVDFYVSSGKRSSETEKYLVKIIPQRFGDTYYFQLHLEKEISGENMPEIKKMQSFNQQTATSSSISEDVQSEDHNACASPVAGFPLNGRERETTWKSLKSPMLYASENTEANMLAPQGTELSIGPPVLHNYKKKVLTLPPLLYKQTSNETDLSTKTRLSQPQIIGNSRLIKENNSNIVISSSDKYRGISGPLSSVRLLVPKDAKYSDDENEDENEEENVNEEELTEDNKSQKIIKVNLSSSVGSGTKDGTRKVEKEVKMVPKNLNIQVFYYVLLGLIAISGIPLIVFRYENQSIMTLVENNIETISTSIFRTVRIVDVTQSVRMIWEAQIGFLDTNRYAYIGWDEDLQTSLKLDLLDMISGLNVKNNELRQFVPQLSPNMQTDMFADKIPVFEMANNGSIESTRTRNTFDIISELVAESTELIYSSLPADNTNPYLMFCINNTLNDVLVSCRKTIPILVKDTKLKLSHQTAYMYAMISCLGFLGALTLIFLFHIERQLVKDRTHFMSIFLMQDEESIQKHLSQVHGFMNMFNQYNAGKNIVLKNQESSSNGISSNAKTKQAKNANMIGINSTLILLFITGVLFLALIFSPYLLLTVYVTSNNSATLTKMNMLAKSNQNLFEIDVLLSTIYEYVQENATTYLENQPIKTQWETHLQSISTAQDFYLLEVLKPSNGFDQNKQLKQMITGNLCAIIPESDPDLAKLCPTMGAGAATRGIVGLLNYFISTAKDIKYTFDYSQRTWNDTRIALSSRDLMNFEVFYPFLLDSFTWIDKMIKVEIIDRIESSMNMVLAIVVVYSIIYATIGVIICNKVKGGLEAETAKWRRLLIQIPFSLIIDSKLIKAYLVKTSNRVLTK